MSLSKPQADWLYRFTRGAVVIQDAPVDQNVKDLVCLENDELRCQLKKEEELTRSADYMATVKDDLRNKLNLTFEFYDNVNPDAKRSGISQAATLDSRGPHRDFDTMDTGKIVSPLHQNGQATEFGGKVMGAMNAMKPLADEAARLRGLMVDQWVLDEVTKLPVKRSLPLFSDQDIERGLYTPLVREQVVPETFVPDRYSADAKMMKQSDEDYIKECRAAAAEVPKPDPSGAMKAIVTTISTIVQVRFGMGDEVALIAQAAEAGLNGTIDLGMAVKGTVDSRSFNGNDFDKVCASVSSAVGKAMTAKLDSVYGGDWFGQALSFGLSATGALARSGVWLRRDKDKRGPFPASEIFGEMVTAASNYLAAKSDKTEHSTSTWYTTGATACKEFGVLLQKAVPQINALGSNPDATLKRLLANTMLQAATGAAKAYSDYAVASELNSKHLKIKPDGTENRDEVENQDINRGQDIAGREKDSIQDLYETAAKWLNQSLDEDEEKAKVQDALTMIEADKKKFEASLERLGELDPDRATDDEKKSIGALIAQIERDRMLLEGLFKLPQTASAFEHFCAPLQVAGAAGRFMANVVAAHKRTKALEVWRDANEAAISSRSAFSSTIQNFISNQEFQRYHQSFQAVLQLLQIGFGVAGTIYAPMYGAGLAAKAGAALEDSGYQYMKQCRADKAWKVTEKALANPGNRRLGHAARLLNPTLAKYSIAYGALMAHDPIAMGIMKKCGLDRETLARPDANVGLVKKYLQTLYNDDPVVLGPVPKDPKQKQKTLPAPELTLKSWKRTLELLRQHEGMEVFPPYAITFGMDEVEQLLATGAQGMTIGQMRQAVGTLNSLADRFKEFVPVDGKGIMIAAAVRIFAQFSDLAGGKAMALQAEIDVADAQAAAEAAAAAANAAGAADGQPQAEGEPPPVEVQGNAGPHEEARGEGDVVEPQQAELQGNAVPSQDNDIRTA